MLAKVALLLPLLVIVLWGFASSDSSHAESYPGTAILNEPNAYAEASNAVSGESVGSVTPTPSPACGPAWRVVASPNVGSETNFLFDIAAISADDIWAVGRYEDSFGTSPQTLTMHWNGTQWSIVPSPNVGTEWNDLQGVTAISTNDVWAVGYSGNGNNQTLTMHWDGTQWSIVPSPNPSLSAVLLSVAATSATDIWAVGDYSNGGRRTLTMHWDGTQWTIVPSPNAGTGENYVNDVAALSADDAWVVGAYNSNQTLIMHWDGIQWSIVPTANAGPLNALTMLTANDVWAVGVGITGTLTMHWDGFAWSVVPSFSNLDIGELNGVTAVSTNDVWAVGLGVDSDKGLYGTLTLHWNGVEWSIIPSPSPGSAPNILLSVAHISPSDIWAVGTYADATDGTGPYLTLVERYSDPCATPVPTATPSVVPTSTLIPTSSPSRTPTTTVNSPTTTSSPASTNTALPSSTLTRTPTLTPVLPTATPPICGINSDYVITASSGATIVPGTTDIGNHCDDCVTNISLPFPVRLYDQTFASANVSSNGNLQFLTDSTAYTNTCLPTPIFNYAIMPCWDDLRTDATSCTGGCGIFTSVTGTAPSRVFNIEWRTAYFMASGNANFEVRLYEDPGVSRFDFIYRQVSFDTTITTGVQKGDGSRFTQYTCNTGGITQGLQLSFSQPACATATPTNSPMSTSTSTTTYTSTPVSPTNTLIPATPTPLITATATATATSCPLLFTDVSQDNTFYPSIRCLACRGIISGYADGTFRPNNQVTRGQLAKIVSNAAGFTESPDPQIFQDVSSSNTFYQWINRLARRGHMSGYPCGGVGEPCITGMPYFRPFANATRGQTSKIVSNAAGYTEIPTEQTFEDVPPTHTFYREIQRLATRNIMQGYPCGGAGEPCLSGRPYFRPANNVTRGQSSKIVANAFYPDCQTPARP